MEIPDPEPDSLPRSSGNIPDIHLYPHHFDGFTARDVFLTLSSRVDHVVAEYPENLAFVLPDGRRVTEDTHGDCPINPEAEKAIIIAAYDGPRPIARIALDAYARNAVSMASNG